MVDLNLLTANTAQPQATSQSVAPMPQTVQPSTPPVAQPAATKFGVYQKKQQNSVEDLDDPYAEGPGFPPLLGRILLLIGGRLAYAMYLGGLYFTQGALPIVPEVYQQRIQRIQSRESMANAVLPLNNIQAYQSFSLRADDAKENLARVLNANDIHYVHKKDITSTAVQQLVQNLIEYKKTIEQTKKDIAEFGFYPQELAILLDEEKTKSSMQQSLLSLETIKFATAIEVFSYLDNFMAPFVRQTRQTTQEVNKKIRIFKQRAELDIANYLQSCYLNPFESIQSCDQIGDFANYFTYIDQEVDFDTELFITLMTFAEQKLEEDQFPSLSLVFDRFDPTSQKLSFTATINTTSYDRQQLEQAGIFAPQIFIVKSLVNLLKQSKFVLGESININQLNVQEKRIDVGGTQEEIHTTNLRFSLPLQKATQREIFDYQFTDVLSFSQ